MFNVLFLISHFCIHDSAPDLKPKIEMLKSSMNADISSYKWENIRLKFDFDSLLEGANDPLLFKEEGQYITWSQGTFKCYQGDLLTESKRKALIGTFNFVKLWVENTFKVRRIYNSPYSLSQWSDNQGKIKDTQAVDTDLYISIFVRPYGASSTAAVSTIKQLESPSYRPNQGGIFFNAFEIPDEPVNITTWKNGFFSLCLHEVVHLLGFSYSRFEDYHPINDFTKFNETTCSFTKLGKNFTFLITPYAHKFAVKRFNQETFVGDNGATCPSGIELENDGTGISKFNHLETRVYMTDIMISQQIAGNNRFMRFTDATAAVLLDTGNYKIDFKQIQPILWGNRDTISENKYIDDFATGPPQLKFPDLYLLKGNSNDQCGFDYKFYGFASETTAPDCRYPFDPVTKKYCDGIQFYNPLNEKTVVDNTFNDFQRFKLPIEVCPEGYATLPLIGRCLKTDIVDEETLNFSTELFSFQCKLDANTDKINYIYTYKYKCPNFERFLRTLILYDCFFKSDPFASPQPSYFIKSSTNSSTVDFTPYPTLSNVERNIYPIFIVICVVLSLLIVSFIVVVVVVATKCYKKHKLRSSGDISDFTDWLICLFY